MVFTLQHLDLVAEMFMVYLVSSGGTGTSYGLYSSGRDWSTFCNRVMFILATLIQQTVSDTSVKICVRNFA